MADDDDFDLFGSGGKGHADLELEEVGPARRQASPAGLPALEDGGAQGAPSGSALRPSPTGPGSGGAPRPESGPSSGRAARPASEDPLGGMAGFGSSGESLGDAVRYAFRVFNRRRVLAEMRVLRRRRAALAESSLEEAEVGLGRALADAPQRIREPSLASAFATADARAKELAAVVSEGDQVRGRAVREQQLAAARMESATAGLDPFEREEERGRADLARAEADLAGARAELERLETEFRDAIAAGRTDAETMAASDRAIDAARRRVADATRRHRDTLMRLSELRRRVLVQAGRLAEAAASVDAARVRGRREQTDLQRREAEAADRLREAWAALGRAAFQLGRGQGLAGDPFARVERAAADRDSLRREVEDLAKAADAVDAEAYRRGSQVILVGGIACAALVLGLMLFG